MKYFSLIWSALFRNKLRTALTMLSVATAFLLFGLLDSVRVAFNSGGSVAGADRLIVASRLSITQMLPMTLQRDIARVDGVQQVEGGAWFGGIYRDPRNFFPNFTVTPDYFALYPEYGFGKGVLDTWRAERTGAIAGEALAKRFGWKVGDTIPLQATIFPLKDGSNAWQVKLMGTFAMKDAKRRGEEMQLLFHWDYFDEANQFVRGEIGWYVVKLAPGANATRVAKAIDAISANSSHETKTQTEQAFNQSFAKQFGDIGMIVTAIMGAVFFTLLLLTGNTMAQAVRERVPELAVLKTLGFQSRSVLWLVLAESMLLVLVGGVLGMGVANALVPVIVAMSGGAIQLPTLQAGTWGLGIGLMLLIGAVVGFLPAWRGMRLNIVDALAGR